MKRKAFFSFEEKERYAKANRLMNLGVWGYDLKLIKRVMLTSVGSDKNNWKDVVQDNRDLRKSLRRQGIGYEDCLCVEVTGEGLMCLHGFYRLEKRMKGVELEKVLGEAWRRIHHGTGVRAGDVRKFADDKLYALHSAFKHSDGVDRFRMRVLHSRGWLRPGWDVLRPILMKWAFGRCGTKAPRYDWELTPEVDAEYREAVWRLVRDYEYIWCLGEQIVLDIGNELWYVKGAEIKVERVEKKGRN